eukprot:11620090-Prorocentrum_lima.AAC.1
MKEQFQRARQEQATDANRVVEMFVSRVLEQKWQEWIATKEPETPKGKPITADGRVARALESMERKMAMLEPSLKD